jgi:ATP-dependent helicase/nuclease subunit B
MMTASPDPFAALAAPAGELGATARAWAHGFAAVRELLAARGWHPSRVVLLVPYAQMMDAGRRAWAKAAPAGFSPRFESSRNWAATLQPFSPGGTDWSGDMARDSLIAASLLERVAGRSLDAGLRATLVGRLVEATRQLAPLAAARPPAERAAWAEALRADLTPASQVLQWEGLVASLALTWAGLSAYATDVLWSDLAAPGGVADALLVVPGFQVDPLAQALLERWGDRGVLLPSGALATRPAPVVVHACVDAEDEAQRAAACVVRLASDGHTPVALVAQDRALTRRIGALLHGAGLSVRDETGWKLSTTHAAARLMSLLRAADRRARTDDVLDWLKQSPQAHRLDALEHQVRTHGLASWAGVLAHRVAGPLVPPGVADRLAGLQASRPLPQWLHDLAASLREDGWWVDCSSDAAGQRVIDVLRLQDGAAHELAALVSDAADAPGSARAGRRWSLAAFSAWVRDTLEAASFQPGHAGDAPVVVLPMAQLLGRDFAAVVAPGCDEVNLPPSPEPPGQWSAAQRKLLGLPSREDLALAGQAAWAHLLTQPHLQLLWRCQHQGDVVAAAPWVQALQSEERTVSAPDPRVLRAVAVAPEADPQPAAADLLPQALSASAYQDLRDCPYRFFALRQLRLQPIDEIEAEPDKRDLGNWLHAVLKAFHEARAAAPDEGCDDRQRLDALAQTEAQARGLSVDAGEEGAGFLPFMAAWPALREGYLAWLAAHEGSGPRFERAEVSLSRSVGPWRLIGQLDRIDRQASPEGPIPLVIDYKTEPRATTLERVKNPLEDTQIAFYAALMGDAQETVRGAYLSITDAREADGANTPTRWVEQEEIALARDQLMENLQHDLSRVAAGHALPALGEGRVCEFCAARGLCRKDFRT